MIKGQIVKITGSKRGLNNVCGVIIEIAPGNQSIHVRLYSSPNNYDTIWFAECPHEDSFGWGTAEPVDKSCDTCKDRFICWTDNRDEL
jgi:hypothetical protein